MPNFQLPPLPPGELADSYDCMDMHEYANEAVQPYIRRINELEAARMAYANEFPLNSEGEPDVGNIHENIRAIKAELAAWKERFSQYEYRPQDDCVTLKFGE